MCEIALIPKIHVSNLIYNSHDLALLTPHFRLFNKYPFILKIWRQEAILQGNGEVRQKVT